MLITSWGKLFVFFKTSKQVVAVVFGNSIFWRVGSKNRAVYLLLVTLIGFCGLFSFLSYFPSCTLRMKESSLRIWGNWEQQFLSRSTGKQKPSLLASFILRVDSKGLLQAEEKKIFIFQNVKTSTSISCSCCVLCLVIQSFGVTGRRIEQCICY